MPKGVDARIEYRTIQLLKPKTLRHLPSDVLQVSPVRTEDEDHDLPARVPRGASDLENLWQEARQADKTYERMVKSVQEKKRTFPAILRLKVSISECSLTPAGHLMFRERLWVPDSEKLRTKIVQDTHDSRACGHPGRDNTGAILARQFFWPKMYEYVRKFVRNCDACGASNSWKDRRQGFLKPLPIPDRTRNLSA